MTPDPVPRKPTNRLAFRGPVSWLLSRQLLAGLKQIILAGTYGEQLDHKDWMRAEVHRPFETSTDEFWFDYIADSGDAQLPTYNVAYLTMSDLRAADSVAGAEVTFGLASNLSAPEINLPRGQFLVVGGDTAYHIADYQTLAERFWKPFRWACTELSKGAPVPRRPLFGVPGNHDYYDALHGFNRQFRRSLDKHVGTFDVPPPPLDIPAFERTQEASYFAVPLPFGWWFWGLDTQEGRLDVRQRYFFAQVSERCGGAPPDRLIVATPEPATVCGRLADPKSAIVKTLKDLGLEIPFMSDASSLPPSKVRLDLSGDTHHYARYWGPPAGEKGAPSNYAAVVAGMGGAFLHPTHTDFHQVTPTVLYPPAEISRDVTAARLFNPWNVARGGLVWLITGVIAMVVAFAAAVPPNTRGVLPSLLGTSPGAFAPRLHGAADEQPLAVLAYAFVAPAGRGSGIDRWEFGIVLLVIALATVALLGPACTAWRRSYHDFASRSFPHAHLPSLLILVVGIIMVGVLAFESPPPPDPGFGTDLFVLASWILFVGTVVWSSAYSAQLFKQAKVRAIGFWEYGIAWAAWLFSIEVLIVTHWRYGSAPLVTVASDTALVIVLFIGTLGVALAGAMVGAEHHPWPTRVGFAFLGLWLGLVLLAFPPLLVFLASWIRIAGGLALLAAAAPLGYLLARGAWKWALLALWVFVGAAELGLLLYHPAPMHHLALLRLAGAGITGAVFGCVWFGWYLAVTSSFDGHNNEVGGACRIERFKQMIRFRLTRNELTAFVIGFDRPRVNACKLSLHLADAFELRPR